MDATQAKVQELVLDYFRQRPDTEVTPVAGGVYRLALKSDLARTEFGGQERLTLVFDSERAYQRLGSVLITPTHPFLDIIRNDLTRHASADPRLAEAHLPAQVVSPDGRVAVPGLVFTPSPPPPSYKITYQPSLIITYRVSYEADERFETLVDLVYDAVSGAPQFDLAARLPRRLLTEGRPPGVDSPLGPDLADLLVSARAEIEARVRPGVRALGRQLRETLDAQTQPLVEYYQKQIAATRDGVTRAQLQDELAKELRDLEGKLTCTTRINLLSVLRLWWPSIDYALRFPARRGDFDLPPIRYDTRVGSVLFQTCHVCGNRTAFDVCVVARHVLCGSNTCHHDLAACATCGDVYCIEHGGPCHDCAAPVCEHDRAACAYGAHPPETYFCPTCRIESFEGRPLCLACQAVCDTCRRSFPHELVATCRLGGEHVCHSHGLNPDGYVCDECHGLACAVHAVQTADGVWACADHVGVADCCNRPFGLSRLAECRTCHTHVCPEHRTTCAACGEVVCLADVRYAADGRPLCPEHAAVATCCHRVFPRHELQPCRDDLTEVLCPDHRVACSGCGESVCRTHGVARYNQPDEILCHVCRHACALCAPERAYLESELRECETCHRDVCQADRRVCVVGQEIVCRADVLLSNDLENLCRRHAGTCIQCGQTKIHRTDRLRTCVICQRAVCSGHRLVCPICKATTLCKAHQPDLTACASCGRTSCGTGSCSSASHTCRRCGMTYCHHCLGSDGLCTTCTALQDNPMTLQWAEFFKALPTGGLDAETARVVTQMAAGVDQLRLRAAQNKSYMVIVALYTPRWFEVWHSHQQLLIVAETNGPIHHITRERAGV